VAEYPGTFAEVAFPGAEERRRWIAEQKGLLLAGRVDRVIAAIGYASRGRAASVKIQAERVRGYYRANCDRMRYDEYIRKGYYIGSGAIESAHRTVVQRRMKLSGQRWSGPGADNNILNLRVCSLSGKWDIVQSEIKPRNRVAA